MGERIIGRGSKEVERMTHRGKNTKKIACSEKITNCGHVGLNPTEECRRNHVECASGGSWGIYLPY